MAEDNETTSCTHYRGYPSQKHKRGCAKGIDIRKHVGGESLGWMLRMPCVKSSRDYDVVPCELFDDSDQAERYADLDRFADAIVAGLCPNCGGQLQRRETKLNVFMSCAQCPDVSVRGCKRTATEGPFADWEPGR